MFEPTSRYHPLETVTRTLPDGRRVAYKRRRFPPRADSIPLAREVTTDDGDRLDRITAKTLGDPEQFWRVCDANNAMNPFDLTDEPGRVLRVPIPQFETPR
ncbi:MAG: hypothetical protein GY859_14205 [Desulfobacterales bacterium]|nr:hypothetical protein [Desulfobacterales bacterium]